MNACRLLLSGIAASIVWSVSPPAAAQTSFVDRYCQVAHICLDKVPARCRYMTSVSSFPESDIPDERRCDPVQNLNIQDINFSSQSGVQVLGFLGREYLVQYDLVGDVDVSADKLAYLLDNLPLAAKLSKHFTHEPYYAEYRVHPSGTWVKGGKGDRYYGEARVLSGKGKTGHLTYLGFGSVNLSKWSFTGEVLLDFKFRPAGDSGQKTVYSIRTLASPGNAFVNSIMDSMPFRYLTKKVVAALIDDLAQDIKKADRTWYTSQIQSDHWSVDELAQIKRLLLLP